MPPRAKKTKYALGRASERIELELPSGNVCLVSRPGVQGLIKAGLLDSLDTLTSIVQIEHIDANDPKSMARAALKAAEDPKKLLEGLEIVDNTVCFVVQEPTVGFNTAEAREAREAKAEDEPDIYIEDVDLEDKMFIFQFVVGGTRDLETFRAQSQTALGALSDVQDLPEPAERSAGDS